MRSCGLNRSFRAYVAGRFNVSLKQVYRLMNAADVCDVLAANQLPVTDNIAQAIAMYHLTEVQQVEVWTAALRFGPGQARGQALAAELRERGLQRGWQDNRLDSRLNRRRNRSNTPPSPARPKQAKRPEPAHAEIDDAEYIGRRIGVLLARGEFDIARELIAAFEARQKGGEM